jgi:hypothetical protein
VRRNLSVLCLLAAWLCANGVVLDLVQVYAWARMFTGYAQTVSIRQAAAETFDPGKPCAICKAVQKARDAGPKPAATAAVERITLICQRTKIVLTGPSRQEWPEASPRFAPAWREPVPQQPPRVLAA